ncbi:MAG: hypothetical protein Q8O88_03485 [bacterium]|nr:hypothetical protein [bacterium]
MINDDNEIPVLVRFPDIEGWSIKEVPIPECEIRKNEYEDRYQYWIFNNKNNIVAFIDTKGELKIYTDDQVMWTATDRIFDSTPRKLKQAVRYAWLKLKRPS